MLELEKIKKILIIRLSAIGDVIHCLPVLQILKENLPQSKISWAVDELAADLLQGHSFLEEVIVVPAKRLEKKLKKTSTLLSALREIKQLRSKLEKEKFDLVLDLHGLLKSGLVSYFTKAKARLVYPLARDFSQLFATKQVANITSSTHAVDKYLDTMRYLGLEIKKIEFPLNLSEKEILFAQRFLTAVNPNKKKVIAFNPGASRLNKQWPPEKFALLANQLSQERDFLFVIFGSKEEAPLARKIAGQMQKQPIIAAGKTSLRQSAALLANCSLLIAGDTGTLHLAAATGIPIIALFGPTDYHYSGPYTEKRIIISKNMECAPCFLKGDCPQNNSCIKDIPVEEVLVAVKTIVNSSSQICFL